jgi:hypothetical protein
MAQYLLKIISKTLTNEGLAMSDTIGRTDKTVLATYDLCIDCTRNCKSVGPLWCRLECPSSTRSELKYRDFRVVDMTDKELVSRIAYG